MTRTHAPTPRRPRRWSCRAGCTVAALLVTVGGLRLLAAAEPGAAPSAGPAAAVRVAAPHTVAEAFRPFEGPVPWVGAVDVERAVGSRAAGILCTTGACGFERVTSPLEAAWPPGPTGSQTIAWTRLAAAPPLGPVLEPWGACGPVCTDDLRPPVAPTPGF